MLSFLTRGVGLALTFVVALAAAMFMAEPSMAAVPALDVSDAVTYLETNAGGGISAVGIAVLSLAGLAMAISWIKATFFG